MNNYLAIIDLETGDSCPATCAPIQIAAVVLHPKRLSFEGEFVSMMWADESQLAPQALAVNKKTVEEIQQAPPPKQVFADFTAFINRFNHSGSPYNAPIMCGYNIDGFDSIIIDRLCKEFGPWDDKRQCQKLFNQFMKFDLCREIWKFNESLEYLPNIKLDTVRAHMGLSNVGGHDALEDCRSTAKMVARMFDYNRRLAKKFFESSKGCFSE